MRVLVNTISCKKRGGGVFQISCNFLKKTLAYPEIEWYYITSQDVDDEIGNEFKDLKGKSYFVFPTQLDKKTFFNVKKSLKQLELHLHPDIIYTLAAPSYFFFKTPEVMRFTNPWITHPNKYSWSILSVKNTIIYYIKSVMIKMLIKKAHFFITQSETCKKGIMHITKVPSQYVKVVPNVLPGIYNYLDKTPITDDSEYINIACVGGAIPHKNFDILPEVANELRKLGINNVRFHTTLDKSSPITEEINNGFKKYNLLNAWFNHGRISQQQLSEMYRRCQLCFLPTLLEVFSATTIEAMFFQLPIVATDFEFNSEVLENSCLYYKPKNAKDAAQKLSTLILDPSLQETLKHRMQDELKKFGNYDEHFNAIVDALYDFGKILEK